MSMTYEELDQRTREFMLSEFETEQTDPERYFSRAMSTAGLAAFPDLMRDAIRSGNEVSLIESLHRPEFWKPRDAGSKTVNLDHASTRLGLSEFSTWYVRGLGRRLMEEGVTNCQVYRGAEPKRAPASCSQHEGQTMPVSVVYEGHRARYWPEPDPSAFSIPYEPGCHHVVRRVT